MKSSVLLLLAIALTSEAEQAGDLAGSWQVSFNRSLSSSASWTGREDCKGEYWNHKNLSRFLQYEKNERQVDCTIDTYNNAMCVSSSEVMPRKGAYVPSAGLVVTNELMADDRGRPIPVVVVFKVWLDDDNKPLKALTELHFTLPQDWPARQPYEDVERPDQIGPYCTAYLTQVCRNRVSLPADSLMLRTGVSFSGTFRESRSRKLARLQVPGSGPRCSFAPEPVRA